MPSKDVVALAKRIRDEFGIDADPHKFHRTYAGYHQRAAGECTWVIYSSGLGLICVGGFEPIRTYVTKKNRLAISERHFNGFELYAICPGEPGYEAAEPSCKDFVDGIVTLSFQD